VLKIINHLLAINKLHIAFKIRISNKTFRQPKLCPLLKVLFIRLEFCKCVLVIDNFNEIIALNERIYLKPLHIAKTELKRFLE